MFRLKYDAPATTITDMPKKHTSPIRYATSTSMVGRLARRLLYTNGWRVICDLPMTGSLSMVLVVQASPGVDRGVQ